MSRLVGRPTSEPDLYTVVGHVDWYTGNLRWQGGSLPIVHDWDSVAALSEALFAAWP